MDSLPELYSITYPIPVEQWRWTTLWFRSFLLRNDERSEAGSYCILWKCDLNLGPSKEDCAHGKINRFARDFIFLILFAWDQGCMQHFGFTFKCFVSSESMSNLISISNQVIRTDVNKNIAKRGHRPINCLSWQQAGLSLDLKPSHKRGLPKKTLACFLALGWSPYLETLCMTGIYKQLLVDQSGHQANLHTDNLFVQMIVRLMDLEVELGGPD